MSDDERAGLEEIRSRIEELAGTRFSNSDLETSVIERRKCHQKACIYDARCAWELKKLIETGKTPIELGLYHFAVLKKASHPYPPMGPKSLAKYYELADVWDLRSQGKLADAKVEPNAVIMQILETEGNTYEVCTRMLGYFAATGRLLWEQEYITTHQP